MAGGFGNAGRKEFYQDKLVGEIFSTGYGDDASLPDCGRDTDCGRISDSLLSHSSNRFQPALRPPTRKCVEMAVAVIVGFKDGKISHEHIYWNQACLLVQIGLIDPRGLAVTGVESILKVLNPALGISPTT